MITPTEPPKSTYWFLALSAQVFILFYHPAQADESDFFLPETLNYYNPLQHNAPDRIDTDSRQAMSNQQLEEQAGFIRDGQANAEQRILNHRWLENGGNEMLDDKSLSTLLHMGFKTYWNGVYDVTFYPSDDSDSGNIEVEKHTEGLDYQFKVSSSKARIGVEYEF